MRTTRTVIVGAGAALLAALLGGAPAYAAGAVLTTGSSTGPDVAVGDVVAATLAAGTAATLYSSASGSTGISCTTSAFAATVTANPAAPGVATESLTSQTFSTCTANVFGVTGVRSITVDHLPYSTSVASDGTVTIGAGAAGAIQTTVVLNTLLGTTTCVYQVHGGTIAGTASNDGNSISFASQQFDRFSGPGTCFSNGFFTARYAPVVDQTAGGDPVVVN